MKKLLISGFAVLACMAVVPASATWTFDSNFGTTNESCQFLDIDSNGLIWVTDYGAPGTNGLFVWDSAGAIQFGTHILEGRDTDGSLLGYSNPGGVAFNPNDGYVYVVGRYGVTADRPLLFRYDITSGTAVNGIRCYQSTGADVASPGDIDFDASGNLVWCNKVAAQWWVFAAASVAYPATSATASFDLGVTGWHINRGCSVSPDGSTVYLADESDDDVDIWTGSPSTGYTDTGTSLDSTAAGNQSGCETDANGNVFVSCTASNSVNVYDSAGVFIETIADASMHSPRGCVINAAGDQLFVAQFTGTYQQMSKFTGSLDIQDWMSY